MSDILQTPPIRTALQENAAKAKTAKEWYLYWRSLGDLINRNRQDIADLTGVVTTQLRSGTHAARLLAAAEPSGAIWSETDRGGVLYQAQGDPAVWTYVAGAMEGTFSPDERPADLGAADAGFGFLSLTTPPRKQIWSGAAWLDDPFAGHPGIDVPGLIRTTAGVAPTDGVGVEMSYQGGEGYVLVYDRDAGTYEPLNIAGSPVIVSGGADIVKLLGRLVEAAALVHVTGGVNPTSGAGLEISYQGQGYIVSYDRNASAFLALSILGQNIGISASGTLTLTAAGYVLPSLPAANPGAGTKRLWYDPADANRVKFAP